MKLNKIYYDKQEGLFKVIRSVKDDGYIVTTGSIFYSDAAKCEFEYYEEKTVVENYFIEVDNIQSFEYAFKKQRSDQTYDYMVLIPNRFTESVILYSDDRGFLKKVDRDLYAELKAAEAVEDYEKCIEIKKEIDKEDGRF